MTRTESLLQDIKNTLLELLPEESRISTRVPGTAVTRFNSSVDSQQCFYRPMLAMVFQGQKRSVIGGVTADYGPGECAAVSLDLPGVYRITEVTADKPFLSVSMQLDRSVISELLTECPYLLDENTAGSKSVIVARAEEELLDAVYRLVRLYKTPERVPLFSPMLIKEIHFLLLSGAQKSALLHFCSNHSRSEQIVRAIDYLRDHYKENVDIDTLAEIACMAPSTLHRHFKEVTSCSPIQFQKRLRLHEAEKLLIAEGKRIEFIASEVGYESTSQFSREYKRLFGASPREDAARKKATLRQSEDA